MALRRLSSDKSGTIAVTVALASTALMGFAAFGIDLGVIVHAKRKAQGAADVAAMLAASDPTQAEAVARRSLADNGYGTGAAIAISTGRYAADSHVVPADRYKANTGPTNAVRVNLKANVKTSFAQVIGLPAQYEIGATGTAASAQLAAFSIGSGLVALDGGIANAVLGALLGTNLSLSAMDYNALLSGKVDSYGFLGALGARLQLASFDDILAANVSIDQIALALKVAGQGQAGIGAALDSLLAAGPTGARFKVGDLIDLGDAGALSPGSGTRGPAIGVMDTLSAAASLANGQRQVSVDLGAKIPGLLRTKLTIGIGERRQSSGWVQPGTPSATVKTAQTRLLIEATLTAPLGLAALNLPIYVEAAYAKATLRSVTCPWSQANRRQVSIDAQPGVLDLAIANVAKSSLYPDGPKPDLSRDANLLSLPLLSVTGKARASLGSPYPQTLTFGDADITSHRMQRVASTGLSQSLTKSLLDTLSLNVDGLALLTLPGLKPALTTTLSLAAPALDSVLDNTLRTLGIQVGFADVTVDGTRCDHAVLVQ